MANSQLKELTLNDELTCIPNRRNFNNYIESALKSLCEKAGAVYHYHDGYRSV